MDKMDESLSEIFDADPINLTKEERKNSLTIIPEIDDDVNKNEESDKDEQLEKDHQEARKNIYHLIQQGHTALDYALELAKDSDSARGFEVVAGLMKTISDMNSQLMDTHSKKKHTKNIGAKRMDNNDNGGPGSTTNNAIFVGSTSELSKMIESMSNKKG